MINPEFGYYECDGIKFEKKIEALIYSSTQNKPVNWYFQDHIFSKHNWQIEPEESLNELYDKRAKELREKYDYLILCFSGGADSNNVLESFIRQNIHLDEIVSVHTAYVTNTHADFNIKNKLNSNLSAEHLLNTVPRLKYAKEKLSKTKITILDDTEVLFKNLKNYEEEDWIFNRNDHLGPIGPLRFNFFEVKDLRLKFDKYKTVGIIYGRDKPKIRFKDNKIYITFSDVALNTIKASTHNPNYNNITTEYFYWNSSCLTMLAKQAHVVKRWLFNNPAYLMYWKNSHIAKNRSFQEKLLRNIIYTTWNNEWFQVEKPSEQWSNGENWFSKDLQFSREYKLWKNGLDFASSLLKEHIIFLNNMPNGFKIYSKWYYIDSFTHPT